MSESYSNIISYSNDFLSVPHPDGLDEETVRARCFLAGAMIAAKQLGHDDVAKLLLANFCVVSQPTILDDMKAKSGKSH